MRILVGLLLVAGLGGMGLALMAALKEPSAQVASVNAPAPPPTVHILVANRQVRAGSLLALEQIGTQEVPQGSEPPGSYTDTIANRSALHGSMVRQTLMPNDPILAPNVLSAGDRGFLAAVLQTGMRAVTVGVDNVSGTAGLIWPGDRVDLVLIQAIEDAGRPIDRRVSGETVLTNIRVIAVDQQLIQGGQGSNVNASNQSGNRTVTLEVSSYDAERVTVAARLGKLSLVVRASASGDGADAADASAAGPARQSPGQQSLNAQSSSAQSSSAPSVPIAWGGDVSPALRDHSPAARSGSAVRVHEGTKDPQEVKF